MDASLAITIASISIITLTLFASFMIKDKDDAKPARYFFRSFYLFSILFFISVGLYTLFAVTYSETASDFFLALLHAFMLHAVVWRCQSGFPLWLIYLGAAVFFLFGTTNLQPGVAYVALYNIIGSYLLFTRKPISNSGDKAMAIVMLLWTVTLTINIAPYFFDIYIDTHFYISDGLYTYLYAPAYVSGFSVFLITSYMIDTQNEIAEQANTDSLTQLYNRRYFTNNAANLIADSKNSASVIVCDIDNLKTINDHYGHDVGDQFIIKFAEIMKKHAPKNSIPTRFGGDEFVLLLPNCSSEKALTIANNMCEETAKVSLAEQAPDFQFSCSFGVHQFSDSSAIEQAIKQADGALYQAKSKRNQVRATET